MRMDVITFNAVINACEKGAEPQRALELLTEMQQKRVEPDVVTFSLGVSFHKYYSSCPLCILLVWLVAQAEAALITTRDNRSECSKQRVTLHVAAIF